MFVQFVNCVQPLFEKDVLRLSGMPLLEEFVSRAARSTDFQGLESSVLQLLRSEFAGLLLLGALFTVQISFPGLNRL